MSRWPNRRAGLRFSDHNSSRDMTGLRRGRHEPATVMGMPTITDDTVSYISLIAGHWTASPTGGFPSIPSLWEHGLKTITAAWWGEFLDGWVRSRY